jgi:pyruvate dehydrogenase E1 component
MVANMTDEDIWRLNRGGHDPIKVYAAYARPCAQGPADGDPGQDGQGLRHGRAGEGMNITHSQKKMGEANLKAFRDRFNIPISDDRSPRRPSTSRRRTARR